MHELINYGLSNALLVTLLAPCVYGITKVWRNPFLAHLLWLLLLVKLITPPLVPIPVTLSLSNPTAEVNPSASPAETSAATTVSESVLTVHDENPRAQGHTSTLPKSSSDEHPETVHRLANNDKGIPVGESASAQQLFTGPMFLLAIWLSGSLGILCITLIRIKRFHRLVTTATSAPSWIQERLNKAASLLGVRRHVRICLVDAQLSPLLWAVGRHRVVVFPRALLHELSQLELSTLLTHEMVHLRRKDHLVRWLELAVGTLYWWHPVVWWSRWMLRQAEEQACDASVIYRLPESARTYIGALVKSMDVLSEPPRPLPSLASGLGAQSSMQRRIEAMIQARCQGSLHWAMRAAVLAAGCVLLPLYVRAEREQVTAGAPATTTDAPATEVVAGSRQRLPEHVLMRLGTIRARHNARVRVVALSADGKQLASASSDGVVHLWNLRTGYVNHSVHLERRIERLAFSPSGTKLYAANRSKTVYVCETSSGKTLVEKTLDDKLLSIAPSPDGRMIATGHAGGTVRLWHAESFTPIKSLQTTNGAGAAPMTFSASGKTLAVGAGPSVLVWKLDSGDAPLVIKQAHQRQVVALRFVDNGRTLSSSGHFRKRLVGENGQRYSKQVGEFRLWDARTGKRKPHPLDRANLLAFHQVSPNGQLLAAADEQRIQFWDFATGAMKREIKIPNYLAYFAHASVFSPDSRFLAAGCGDNAVRLFNIATGEQMMDLGDSHLRSVTAVDVSPDGRLVVSGDFEGAIRVWDLNSGRVKYSLQAGDNWLRGVAFSPDGSQFAAAGDAGVIKLWNTASGEEQWRVQFITPVRCIAFSGDARWIAAATVPNGYGGRDQFDAKPTIYVLDAKTGDTVAELASAARWLTFAAGDNQTLTSVDTARIVRHWDVPQRKLLKSFPAHLPPHNHLPRSVRDWAIIPARNLLLANGRDALFSIDLVMGKATTRFPIPQGSLLALSPDHRMAATAPNGHVIFKSGQSRQWAIQLWDLQTGRELKRIDSVRPGNGINSAVFSPDGTKLITGMEDTTVLIWDVSC